VNNTAKRELQTLVERYSSLREEYLASDSNFNEIDTRSNFIDELFKLLGWDVLNEKGQSQRFREVIRETRISVDELTKRPDYEFRLGSIAKFFVEAKKPNVNLLTDPKPAFQVRRYGWSGNLPISIITNFEHLIIYDTTNPPNEDDHPSFSRIKVFGYKEYVDRFEEIQSLLARDSVYGEDYDTVISGLVSLRDVISVDEYFVAELNNWRLELGKNIHQNLEAVDMDFINGVVQRLLLRILFLRMCEDRGIQTYETLKQVADSNSWLEFLQLLRRADEQFNTDLFSVDSDPFFDSDLNFQLDTSILSEIIEKLYYPYSPYSFAVFSAEFLGEIYEYFLAKRLVIGTNNLELSTYPDRLSKEVVTTPRPVIQQITDLVIRPELEGKTYEQLLDYKILDPACGSAGFLISAFDLLIEIAINQLLSENPTVLYEEVDGFQLPFELKKNLLVSCLFGVDRDFFAVQVAKFSLFIKLMEKESNVSLPDHQALLPILDDNIVWGDSLVDERIYESGSDPVELIGIPFNWENDIASPFDIVIGNPPYLTTEHMINIEPVEYEFYKSHYESSYKQFDKYYLFIELGLRRLLKDQGRLAFLVSRKFTHIESGKKLRRLIFQGRHLYRLIDFGSTQLFSNKTNYTCIIFLKNNGVDEEENTLEYVLLNSLADWVAIAKEIPAEDNIQYFHLPREFVDTELAWLLPNTPDELELLNNLRVNTVRLQELFNAYNGIQTSRNSVYVISSWMDEGSHIKFSKDNQEWMLEKELLRAFFEDDRKDSRLKSFHPLPKTSYVIFPYRIIEECEELSAELIPLAEIRDQYPGIYSWLKHNEMTLRKRDISPKPGPDEWHKYGRQQALTAFEDRPKIVVGVNSLGEKYVYDDEDVILASGGTAGEVAISKYIEPDLQNPYSLYFILALLNHKAIEYFCRKRGSTFRGGWYARGTAVLYDIPIPLMSPLKKGWIHPPQNGQN
jgi:type I restriction-modification system DNA methylase subunit